MLNTTVSTAQPVRRQNCFGKFLAHILLLAPGMETMDTLVAMAMMVMAIFSTGLLNSANRLSLISHIGLY
jgi:hypothetical protein